jgi:preprotein translocase subunit SecE
MTANKKIVSLITLILTVALMFSLCSLSVFAETEADTADTSAATENVAETEAETTAGTTAETQGSSSTTTTGTEKEENDIVGTIVSLSILGVIIIVVALFCIIKREKVGKFLRSLKSESKKVVWLPWNQVRKNTIVVIIVVVIVAIVIGVLDAAFSSGIGALSGLF